MKGIAKIAQRLISVFLVMVVSSLTFLSSPANAAVSASITLNEDNFQTEVLQSSKPVVVITIPSIPLEQFGTSLEKLKSDANQVFGNEYKVIVNSQDKTTLIGELFIPVPLVYPPYATLIGFKNGEKIIGRPFPVPSAKSVFEQVKENLS